jgi:la-related protein 4
LSLTVIFCVSGYVYMNGDIEKLPPGVVFAPTPEIVAATGGGGGHGTSTDSPTPSSSVDCVVNGVGDDQSAAGRATSPMAAGTTGATAPNTTAATTQANPDIPLEQLKQMLSSQLEYYFSRCVISWSFKLITY